MALIAGRKTMTRRVLKPQPYRDAKGWWHLEIPGGGACHSSDEADFRRQAAWLTPYRPGQLLWVKHAADCFPVHFKPIPFGNGKYAVGTDGNLYARTEDDWVKRAPRLSHNGYEEISLRYNGDRRPFRINRLVAEAFYGPAPHGYVCRHLDGCRRNNEPSNLDWGTPAQNSADASAAGSFSGERASQARLSADDAEAIRRSPEPQAVLADRYGVTQPTISKIKRGKRWGSPGQAPPRNLPAFQLWRSPIYCPRWASRITLEVTAVKVERLWDISEEDAIAEGGPDFAEFLGTSSPTERAETPKEVTLRLQWPQRWFAMLWNDLHGPGAWEENPWVVAYDFKVFRSNIDRFEASNECAG